ncbi:MAG: sugar ABC transporter substrate-binding protein [Marvinbryantia sp.]|uniref:sugar ABC transporter substrate-binding protein n=1 Tax=Marvinbryantia sp. TaxID=2496532 RepID=UPI0026215FCE|nr:sugar ABC transporter substrate-binding protein [uncultured Marvinbryantia sp.]
MKKQVRKAVAMLFMCMAAICAMAVQGIAEDASEKLPEKFKIGVVIWSTVDDLGRTSSQMLDYASEVLGVEMVYNTNISSPESQITATENLIAAGCDAVAICNYSDDILPKIAKLCQENEVYFTLIWRSIADPEVKEIVESCPFYLGNTCEDEEKIGYRMGESLYNKGCENIAVITMEKGDATADARDAGFDRACEEFGMNRISEVRNNAFTAEDATKAVENFLAAFPEMDGIYVTGGSGTILEGVIQGLALHGKTGEVKVACVDFIADLDKYIAEGAIDAISGGHFVDPLFSYILMVNKLAGTPLSETCETINLNFVNLESPEDAVNYYTYVEGDEYPYNAEEIRSMVKYFNPDMTIEKLKEIADAYSVDDVVARHTAE